MEVVSDTENILLNRREVCCIFKDGHGHVSRLDAVQAVSQSLKVGDKKKVYVVSMDGKSGVRDFKGVFYIYDSEEVAKRDLPEYILKRNSAKEAAAEEAKAEPKPKEKAKKPKE